jgi:hypothetical protein
MAISKEVREYAEALYWKKHREKTVGDDGELRRLKEQMPRGGQRNRLIAENQFNRRRKSIEAQTESYIEAFRKFGQIPEESDINKIATEISKLADAQRQQQLGMAVELMPPGVAQILGNMSHQGLVAISRQELELARREMVAEESQRRKHLEETTRALDLSALAKELSLLRAALLKEATEFEHEETISAIVSAEDAAKMGNGAKVLEALKHTGKWALDTATKIGVSVAAEAIKKASGF